MEISLVIWTGKSTYQQTGGRYELTDPAISIPTVPLPSPWITQSLLDAALAPIRQDILEISLPEEEGIDPVLLFNNALI
jgi:hypothetical protein